MRAVLLVTLLLLNGCGWLREREPSAATISAKATSAECELGNFEELIDYRKAKNESLLRTLDCLDKKLDHAFTSLRGAVANEISVAELRRLHREKILKLPAEVDEWWEALEIVLPLFHPEGRPAVIHDIGKQVLARARRDTDLYLRILGGGGGTRPTWLADSETWDAAEAWLNFLSPAFSLNLSKALVVGKRFKASDRHIEAGWIAKNLVVIDAKETITGTNLRTLIRHGIESARLVPRFQLWLAERGLPQNMPAQLVEEANAAAEVWKRYFGENSFNSIDKDLLAWALEQLTPNSNLSTLAGDLVRVSQRLSASTGARDRGLHPRSVLPLLDQLPEIARNFQSAAPAFGTCESKSRCEISLREAVENPMLRLVAMKGPRSWWPSSRKELPKRRLDMHIGWESAVSRLIERAFVTKLFSVFDKNHDGLLSLESSSAEELTETLDLGFTFLRFITLESSSPKHDESEEKVPAMIPIKPGPLTKVLGLLGDRWMPDGDQDGALNADEFFSVVKVYNDINDRTEDAGYALQIDQYLKAGDYVPQMTYYYGKDTYYRRKEFVRALPQAILDGLPHLALELQLDKPGLDIESLFHAVLPIPQRDPLEAINVKAAWASGGATKEIVSHYLQAPDAIAPVAILSVLDRLMIRCDGDENGLLDWRELDCGVPLVLEGGLQTVTSGLLDIDPGPHDASRALLSFLQAPGTPITAAKLIVANGSVRDLSLDEDFAKVLQWLDRDLKISWDDLARFIAARPVPAASLKFWRIEAEKRYRHCDTDPVDGLLQGKKEITCFANETIERILATAKTLTGQTPEDLEMLKDAESVRLGLSLATQTQASVDQLLFGFGIHSHPKRILNLLEEIIRRSVPLWQLPD